MTRLAKKVLLTMLLAVLTSVTSGVVGMIFAKSGGGGGGKFSLFSAPGLTIGYRAGDQISVTQKVLNWIFWWTSGPSAQESSRADAQSSREPPPVDPPWSEPKAPEPAPPATSGPPLAQVLRRDMKQLAGSAPAAAKEPDSNLAPTASPQPLADEPTVIRLDGVSRPPMVFEEHMEGHVEAKDRVELSGSAQTGASAMATLTSVSANAMVNPLPVHHNPAAVVVEENCGAVQGGLFVPPPPPPQGFLICTVRDEGAGNVTMTTYRVPPEP